MNHCVRHYEEPVTAHCRTCQRPYCGRCLVYSFGPKKPPFCVGCALSASGVRNTSVSPMAPVQHAAPDRRIERAQKRAEKTAAKAEARAIKRAGKRHGEPVIETGAFPPAVPVVDTEQRPTAIPVPTGLATPASRYAQQHEHAVN